MKTNTFRHLETLCAGKGIVCEKRGRKIELTTPDGGTTAECDSVAEALDTYRNDSTFSALPIQIRTAPKPAPVDQRIPQLEEMARTMVGDGKAPNLFFVSRKGVILTVTRNYRHAYVQWETMARGMGARVECALEDRLQGTIASVDTDEENPGKLIVIDDSDMFLRHHPTFANS